MGSSPHHSLPTEPLLHAYVAKLPNDDRLARLPQLGLRFTAIHQATSEFLHDHFLDTATDDRVADTLAKFYSAAVAVPLHEATLRRRAGILRHALGYLLRGRDPLPTKLSQCLLPTGSYRIPGLGASFWSAILQALDPARNASWLPDVVVGLRRLNRLPTSSRKPESVYAQIVSSYAQMRALQPTVTAQHLDHFLHLVANMSGRDVWSAPQAEDPIATALHRLRTETPLRKHLKQRGETLGRARADLERALDQKDVKLLGETLCRVDPVGSAASALDWGVHAASLFYWGERLWSEESGKLASVLQAFWQADPVPGAGLWLPTCLLHVRDPQSWQLWNEGMRQGLATIDDGIDLAEPAWVGYALFNEAASQIVGYYALHPLEVPNLLLALGPDRDRTTRRLLEEQMEVSFDGFSPDTFAFLHDLGRHNSREWMDQQRPRYQFFLRKPLRELCQALTARYVEPVLNGVHQLDIETTDRTGRALTSIVKNDYGQSDPYNTTVWITFYSRLQSAKGKREKQAQLFVRLCEEGLTFGLRIGPKGKATWHRFLANARSNIDLLYRALAQRGAFADVAFRDARIDSPEGLSDWLESWMHRDPGAGEPFLEVAAAVATDVDILRSEALVGETLLTFDRLLPLFLCATHEDASPILLALTGDQATSHEDRFLQATHLDRAWLTRARSLLELKRQLILQGVPGTGKTHVAQCLAKLLTGGREDAGRLVQLHPAYSYEEFVEGIKVRSVTIDGRQEVIYPIEEGLLSTFAAEAATKPTEPYVLIVDEINRGNLPRVFGELLYLLEYRDRAVDLPYSRRRFRLPPNLYFLGTMNASDRSVALIDHAVRRRFSFLEMAPDGKLLARWLRRHPPLAGEAFADRVCGMFERLNDSLQRDLGPHARIGHSFFMTTDLNDERLEIIWQHHVWPVLVEHFVGNPTRLAEYTLERFLSPKAERTRRSSVPASTPSSFD